MLIPFQEESDESRQSLFSMCKLQRKKGSGEGFAWVCLNRVTRHVGLQCSLLEGRNIMDILPLNFILEQLIISYIYIYTLL